MLTWNSKRKMFSIQRINFRKCKDERTESRRSDHLLEKGLHVGPDLLGLCSVEVPEDALGPVVGQHRLCVSLHHMDRIICYRTSHFGGCGRVADPDL